MLSMTSSENNRMNGFGMVAVRLLSRFWFPIMLIAGAVIFSTMGFSQSSAKGTIKGKVTDNRTHESLPSVNVTVKGTYYGAVTDVEGNFTIANINVGTYTIELSLLGYKTVQYTSVKVTAGV